MKVAYMLASCAIASTAALGQLSTFDSGPEGWRIAGPDPSSYFADPDATTGGLADWEDGSLRVFDLFAWTWVRAPFNYEGDRSSAYGGTVTFDLYLTTSDGVPYPALMLAGATKTLLYNAPSPPIGVWTRMEIPLTEAGWRVNSYSSGAAATAADMQAVLADLRAVFVLTEWRTGPDDTRIDNFDFPGSCPADFDGTGFVDTDDFTAFVLAFEAGTDDADFDGTGFVDTDDFTAFVLAFEAGC
ncbi:MAG: hypothetical protein AMXMBFR58_37840 [Phycisphaerae bacterium]|nr:hypothetical protein [Phycisphaerales bacterium]MCK6476630.1 hypothetical protein [Phycisphaerales bacterium]